MLPEIELVASPLWQDYELLDTGDGRKLERFGPYTFDRPAPPAVWRRTLSEPLWREATARFEAVGDQDGGGKWLFRQKVASRWEMDAGVLRFALQVFPSRHLGVYPEQAAHWHWMAERVQAAGRTLQVLSLFGYTGLGTLACAAAGADVTHVNASRKVIAWARQNQALSEMGDRPIRWVVEDVMKFLQRETRRGAQYDALLLAPPTSDRGGKGDALEQLELLPDLLDACQAILSPQACFLVLTAYSRRASALSLYYPVHDMMRDRPGAVAAGELVTIDKSAGRALPNAVFARWQSP